MKSLTALALALLFSNPLWAQEEILNFHSEIEVQQDGSLQVTESIEVRAENKQIKRGIYRDFPTRYTDRLGFSQQTGFRLLEVQRDGNAEPHFIKPQANGLRIYIGDQNTRLQPGIHQYRIRYLSDRQIGFFEDFDELYFNVTGNGWIFPIAQASATVTLPQAVDTSQVHLSGYTGRSGSTEQNLRHRIISNGRFEFASTRPLPAGHGLTIVANWPKGLIHEPSPEQRQSQWLQDNRASLTITAGVIIVLLYYLIVWRIVGKDPKAGPIRPRYHPPEGYSPASVRYIRNMKYDQRCFTTALLNLAVKGVINIEQQKDGLWRIQKTRHFDTELAPGEALILDQLFSESDDITLTREIHKRLRKVIRQHEKSLRSDYQQKMFRSNRKFFVPGAILSAGFVLAALDQVEQTETAFATVFFGLFAMMPILVFSQLKKALRRKKTADIIIQAVIQLAFVGFFLFLARDVIESIASSLSSIVWPVVFGTGLLLIINLLFVQWLKAPTRAGREWLDQIEGLALYLNASEDNKHQLADLPDFDRAAYQHLLPYAFALDVEHAWSQRLQNAIDAGQIEAAFRPTGILLHPQYNDMSEVSDALSSGFDGAISSASSAPGSSSGSSGGSSGGGGGGGGGGGW